MHDAVLETVFNDPFCSFEGRFVPVSGDAIDAVRLIKRDGEQQETVFGQNIITSDIEIRVRVKEVVAPAKGDQFEVDGVAYRINASPTRDALRKVWICDCCEAS